MVPTDIGLFAVDGLGREAMYKSLTMSLFSMRTSGYCSDGQLFMNFNFSLQFIYNMLT